MREERNDKDCTGTITPHTLTPHAPISEAPCLPASCLGAIWLLPSLYEGLPIMSAYPKAL